jgi:hypothetical protein
MIIWGSKGKTTEIGKGQFYCPTCQSRKLYSHKEVGKYFTLYFIPLFRTSLLGEYIECQTCFTTFDKKVLEYESTPPKEIQDLLQTISDTSEAGAPLQTIHELLTNQGADKNTAGKLIALALNGKLKVCKTCQLTFSANLSFCSKCGNKLTEA